MILRDVMVLNLQYRKVFVYDYYIAKLNGNFIMKRLLLLVLSLYSGAVCAEETLDLFNGKDLSNWNLFVADNSEKGDSVFSVKNGLIHIKGKPFGFMYTKEVYGNFRLHVEWCYPIEKSNSGIFLFLQEPAMIWSNAVECQLCAEKAGDFVLLGGSNLAEYKQEAGKERPKFPVVKKWKPSNESPIGQWNCADIICKDGTITVFINGTLQNKGSKSLHKKGHIALQSEGGDILFKNVRLTPLQ